MRARENTSKMILFSKLVLPYYNQTLNYWSVFKRKLIVVISFFFITQLLF